MAFNLAAQTQANLASMGVSFATLGVPLQLAETIDFSSPTTGFVGPEVLRTSNWCIPFNDGLRVSVLTKDFQGPQTDISLPEPRAKSRSWKGVRNSIPFSPLQMGVLAGIAVLLGSKLAHGAVEAMTNPSSSSLAQTLLAVGLVVGLLGALGIGWSGNGDPKSLTREQKIQKLREEIENPKSSRKVRLKALGEFRNEISQFSRVDPEPLKGVQFLRGLFSDKDAKVASRAIKDYGELVVLFGSSLGDAEIDFGIFALKSISATRETPKPVRDAAKKTLSDNQACRDVSVIFGFKELEGPAQIDLGNLCEQLDALEAKINHFSSRESDLAINNDSYCIDILHAYISLLTHLPRDHETLHKRVVNLDRVLKKLCREPTPNLFPLPLSSEYLRLYAQELRDWLHESFHVPSAYQQIMGFRPIPRESAQEIIEQMEKRKDFRSDDAARYIPKEEEKEILLTATQGFIYRRLWYLQEAEEMFQLAAERSRSEAIASKIEQFKKLTWDLDYKRHTNEVHQIAAFARAGDIEKALSLIDALDPIHFPDLQRISILAHAVKVFTETDFSIIL